MKKKLFLNKVSVQKSTTHGYGVFADKKIKKGELIEECYVLISRGGDKTLEDYYFDVNGKKGIFTGFGVIYNHATDPNADYDIYAGKKLAVIKAARDIKKGEEIFVSYGEEWFSSRNIKPRSPGKIKPAVKKSTVTNSKTSAKSTTTAKNKMIAKNKTTAKPKTAN